MSLPSRFEPIYGHNNYRGGLISSFEVMKTLKEDYGIKRIINLAYDSMENIYDSEFDCGVPTGGSNGGNQMPENACEPLWAKALGMKFEVYPFWWLADGYESPCDQTRDCPLLDEFWKKIRKALVKGDTYIHCAAGVDRTGAVVGRWMMEADPSATPDGVYDYITSFGGGWDGKNQSSYFDKWMLEGSFNPVLNIESFLYAYRIPLLVSLAAVSTTTYLYLQRTP